MTTTIKAQVHRRWAKGPRGGAIHGGQPWAARAIALDGSGQVVRSTKTAYAASHPEALQLAQVARQALDAELMAEVHASRSRRRSDRCECSIGLHSIHCPEHERNRYTMEATA